MSKLLTIICLLAILFNAALVQSKADDQESNDKLEILSTSLTPEREGHDWYSSMKGGSMLFIKAVGLNTAQKEFCKVYVGDKLAETISVQDTWIKFYTPAHNKEEDRRIKLEVQHGDNIRTSVCHHHHRCSVRYRWDRTPHIYSFEPQIGSPNQTVSLRGSYRMHKTSQLREISIGNGNEKLMCDRSEFLDRDINWWHATNLKCTIPPTIAGGYYNSTVRTIFGLASYQYDMEGWTWDGERYDIKIVPKVSSVSSNQGSIQGQLLTIDGTGFSNNKDEVKITVGGQECKVKESTLFQVKCEVQPVEEILQTPEVVPSSQGLRWRQYDVRWTWDWFCRDTSLDKGVLHDYIRNEEDQYLPKKLVDKRIYNLELTEQMLHGRDHIANVINGFFKAPKTGNYRFFASGDDYVDFFLSSRPGTQDSQYLERLASFRGHTSFRNYFNRQGQITNFVELQEGESYYMEVYHCEGGGGAHLTVSVEMPEERPGQDNVVEEVQKISMKAQTTGYLMQFKLWNWEDSGVIRLLRKEVDSTGRTKKQHVSRDIKKNHNPHDFLRVLHGIYPRDNYIVQRWPLDKEGNKINPEQLKKGIQYDKDGNVIDKGYVKQMGWLYQVKWQAASTQPLLLPTITVKGQTTNPLYNFEILEEQSEPMSGTFGIKVGNYTTGPYAVNIRWDHLRNDLKKKIPKYFNEATDIWGHGQPNSGMWIQFKFKNHGGDVPTIQLITDNIKGGVQGKTVNAFSKDLIKGSNKLFYQPISSDFLQIGKKEHQIEISVNKVTAECENCDYKFIQDQVPVIQEFKETDQGLDIKISQTGGQTNEKDISIYYGGQVCEIQQVTATNLKCRLPKNKNGVFHITAGEPLKVHIKGIGYAIYADKSLGVSKVPEINGVDYPKGSVEGGLVLTIDAKYLPDDCALIGVKVDGCDAEVLACTNTQVTIKTPKCDAQKRRMLQVDDVNNENIQITTKGLKSPPFTNFANSDTNGPTIESLSIQSGSPSQKQDIIIKGTGFGTQKDQVTVLLNSVSNMTFYELGDNKQFVFEKTQAVEYELSIWKITDTEITAVLGGGKSGEYTLSVAKLGFGKAIPKLEQDVRFQYEVIFNSVEPKDASPQGGTLLTLKGSNFSPNPNQNQVWVGENNIMCDVISSSETEIKCRTRKFPVSYRGDSHQVWVTQRVVEESKKPDDSQTSIVVSGIENEPVVNIPDADDVVKVDAGSKYTFKGSNLDGKGDIVIQLSNGVTVNALPETSTSDGSQITFEFPLVKEGIYKLEQIHLSDYGYLNITQPIEFANELRMMSISKRKFASGGADLIIKGNGFVGDQKFYAERTNGGGHIGEVIILDRINTNTVKVRIPSIGSWGKTYKLGVWKDKKFFSCEQCTFQLDKASTGVLQKSDKLNYEGDENIEIKINGYSLGKGDVLTNPSNTKAYLEPKGQAQNKESWQSYPGEVLKVENKERTITLKFSRVPSGLYNVLVDYGEEIGYAWYRDTPIQITQQEIQASTVKSSYAGGASVVFSSQGFPSKGAFKDVKQNYVQVCGQECIVKDVQNTALTCETTQLQTPKTQKAFHFKSDQKLNPIKISSNRNDKGREAQLVDGLLKTYHHNDWHNCWIQFELTSEDQTANIHKIRYVPNIHQNAYDFRGLRWQGSQNGKDWVDLFVIGNSVKQGWNEWFSEFPDLDSYRFIKVSSDSEQHASWCRFAEIEVYGFVLANKDQDNLDSFICDAEVYINGQSMFVKDAVEFAIKSTPLITEISPSRGTTLGGTEISLQGEYFGINIQDVEVSIDGAPCDLQSVKETEIKCTTGKRDKNTEVEGVVVKVNGNVGVLKGTNYDYVDLWSQQSTWGGETPPREGDSVFIPKGQKILLDVSTPVLYAVMNEGTLIFEDTDLTFDAYYFVSSHGTVRIGTEDKPFNSRLTITMHGNKGTRFLPEFGNKCFANHRGTMDIHGTPRKVTWTDLAKTAEIGDDTIEIQGVTDWQVGEVIAIASTDHQQKHAEKRTIVQITNGNKIKLDAPLQYRHYSDVETYGDVKFPMRAEVGLLSRNIVFRGHPDQSGWENHGAHLMHHREGSIGRISYVEFTHVGQNHIIGKYPIHFHRIANCPECYAVGNAVHHGFSRLVTIHGTNFIKVQKNVGYDIIGHMYFVEDGVETHNLIEDNLGMVNHATFALFASDAHVSTYWITHPNNIVRRNRAGGSEFYGFWYELVMDLTAPSYTKGTCPYGETLGVFDNNIAHSNERFGLRIFDWFPREDPCKSGSKAIPTTMKNFQTWKNIEAGVKAFHIGAVEFNNFLLADNQLTGFDIGTANSAPIDMAKIDGALVIGKGQGNPNPDQWYRRFRGIVTPKTNGLLVNNVEFWNIDTKIGMTTMQSCNRCNIGCQQRSGGLITKFSNIKYFDSELSVDWIDKETEIYTDLDGTLTGQTDAGGGAACKYHEHLADVNECHRREDLVGNLLFCTNEVQVKSIKLGGLERAEMFQDQKLKILRLDKGKDVQTSPESDYTVRRMVRVPNDTPKFLSFPFVTGYTYHVHWHMALDWTRFVMIPTPVWEQDAMPVVIRTNYTEPRENFLVKVSGRSEIKSQSQPLNVELNSFETGDYFMDKGSNHLYLGANGKSNSRVQIDIQRPKVVINQPEKKPSWQREQFTRTWSNATQWPNGQLPAPDKEYVIKEEWTVQLDIEKTPKMSKLIIDGILEINEDKDYHSIIADNIWVRFGEIRVGSPQKRYSKRFEIILTGKQFAPMMLIDHNVEASNKMLAVTGALKMYGEVPQTTWTRLAKYASKGDTSITLADDINGWKTGDEIVVGPTGFNPKEHEKKKIKAISGKEITLDSALDYDHFGDGQLTVQSDYGNVDMRAAVGLLTRNIVIRGDGQDDWGHRILVYQRQSGRRMLRGNVVLDGVEITAGGQKDTFKASLDIQRIAKGEESIISKSSIHSALGWCVFAEYSNSLQFTDNVIYDCEKYNIRLTSTNYWKVERNLLMGARVRPDLVGASVWDPVMGLSAHSKIRNAKFNILNNLAVGIEGIGYGVSSPQCGRASGFGPNEAGSSLLGLYADGNGTANCIQISKLSSYKCGMGISSAASGVDIKLSDNALVENKIQFMTWLGKNGIDISQHHERMYISALARPDCPKCYSNAEDCSGQLMTFYAQNQGGGKGFPMKGEPPLGNHAVCVESPIDSKTYKTDLIIENYRMEYGDGVFSKCKNNIVFNQFGTGPDNMADQILKNVVCNNCQKESLVRFGNLNKGQASWKGGCGELPCTGKHNVMVTDTDGKFLGKNGISVLVPNNPGLSHPNCKKVAAWNGMECDDYVYGKLEFENMAVNRLRRLIAPVNISSEFNHNILNQWMEWAWEGDEPLDKRKPRFWGITELDKRVELQFRGLLPTNLMVKFETPLNRNGKWNYNILKFVHKSPEITEVRYQNKKVIPSYKLSENKDLMTVNQECGANIWNWRNLTLEVVVTGDPNCVLYLKKTDSVKISARMTVKVEDFFNSKGGADMLDKLAAYLYIDTSKIRIANVRDVDAEENEEGGETYVQEFDFDIINSDEDDEAGDTENLINKAKSIVEKLQQTQGWKVIGHKFNKVNKQYGKWIGQFSQNAFSQDQQDSETFENVLSEESSISFLRNTN